jgi:hypothetical protein
MIFQQLAVKKLKFTERIKNEQDVKGRSNYSVPMLASIFLRTTQSAPEKQIK